MTSSVESTRAALPLGAKCGVTVRPLAAIAPDDVSSRRVRAAETTARKRASETLRDAGASPGPYDEQTPGPSNQKMLDPRVKRRQPVLGTDVPRHGGLIAAPAAAAPGMPLLRTSQPSGGMSARQERARDPTCECGWPRGSRSCASSSAPQRDRASVPFGLGAEVLLAGSARDQQRYSLSAQTKRGRVPRRPQAKGCVERLQDFMERSFESGRCFANELDSSCSR